MCNYCQTGLFTLNGCGYTPRWRVQRICYDCHGNIHVIVSNGCVCRRLTYAALQENSWLDGVNTLETNGNGCGCARNNTYNTCGYTRNNACFGGCANTSAGVYGSTTQDADAYYARLYGLGSNNNGRGCGCTAL